MFCLGGKKTNFTLLVTVLSLSFVPQLKDTDLQVQRDGSRLSDTPEMEPSSSSVSRGTLSQAARKILAVLRAQSPHAGTYRHWQSQSGRLQFLKMLLALHNILGCLLQPKLLILYS